MARCATGPNTATSGVPATDSAAHRASSASTMPSTTKRCSRVSFTDAASASSASSLSATVVPATGRDSTTSPVRRTSSSGLAPTKPSLAYTNDPGC